MNKIATKLSVKEKLGYGLGDTASHFVWDMVGFWILIFYTDTFGISPAAAGTIMLIARIWDMVTDPLMGIISDRTNTRWGKFRPFILLTALPYAILAVLTFTTPDLSQTGKIIWAATTYFLLMTAYTAINLPYSSLMAVMTSDTNERASINTYRFVSAFSGQLIVTGFALSMALFFGQGNFTTNLMSNNSIGGTALVVGNDSIQYTVHPDFIGVDTLEYSIEDEKSKTASSKIFIVVEPKDEVSNDSLFALAQFDSTEIKAKAKISQMIPYPQANVDVHYIKQGSEPTYIDVRANDNTVNKAKGYQYTLMVLGLLSVVFFLITFFSTKERVQPPKTQQNSIKEDLKNLFNNRPWVILALVGIVSFVMFALQNLSIAYYFKYYIGAEQNVQLFNIVSSIALIVALPVAKPLAKRFGNRNVFMASTILSGIFFAMLFIPGKGDYILIYTFNILAKMTYAPAVVLLWTMLADTADYAEWKTGRRSTGLIFSAATFAQKAGWGIGGALAGWLLLVFKFEPNIVQTESAIRGIKLMVSVIPGILYALCAVLLYFYSIDHKTSILMQKELEQRRAAE
ncbi:glycoside/pentoside/hexuronide:cation symporter, GPH family [Saccharicrinis carchari]|uniref:Glycoside/pentoside/hexuronide:cation symporter, GPH family n=1 Tax=Saccharicrinis carchari TaxID=1168039 RepID=A0A521B9L0_SACCC|nr:MFS transporter [Saccharicrinis carchari]SMO43779.1 glycoside/pentoside/hexuronide:cation symporter, GPH family [Saccharicrinis carchari]